MWALENRPVSNPVGVYTNDGPMAMLRTGDARLEQ